MPQPFKTAVLTNGGAKLLVRAQTEEIKIEFTRLFIGSGSYSDSEKTKDKLKPRTSLKEPRNCYAFSDMEIVSETRIKLSALISNKDLATGEALISEGYYINEIGLYARASGDAEDEDILYSIAVTAGETGDFMPAYDNGYDLAQIIQDFFVTVDTCENVLIHTSNTGAVVLAEDFLKHTGDTTVHITANERKKWNTVSDKADKKVLEDHLDDKSNPHGVTGEQIGNATGTCGTEKGATAKTVDCPGFELRDGARIMVTFSNGNTSSYFTMDVNGTGAFFAWFPVDGVRAYRHDQISEYIVAGCAYEFIFQDGKTPRWVYCGINYQAADARTLEGRSASDFMPVTTVREPISFDGVKTMGVYCVQVPCDGLPADGTGTVYVDGHGGSAYQIYIPDSTASVCRRECPGASGEWTEWEELNHSGEYASRAIYGDTTVSRGRKDGTAVGDGSFAFGQEVEAAGSNSHAEGQNTAASGRAAHAEGGYVKATGDYSHAEGSTTTATGYGAHAEGNSTLAKASASHAEGYKAEAVGYYAHAEGYMTFAGIAGETGANASHAEGYQTKAYNTGAHAEGNGTTATGNASHAEGHCTTADNNFSHASGKYNRKMDTLATIGSQEGDVFVIGNGTGKNSLSNAFRVTFTGEIYGSRDFNSSGADYAEFIKPWADGNPDGEDRVGYFVTVRNSLLQKAEPGDYIAGITSGNPSVVGNADEDYYWKYERDIFNRIVMEDVPETVQETDGEGNPVFDGATGEPVMVETGRMIKNARMKPAEGYDPALQDSYVQRKYRKEWDYVGMTGVIPVRDDGTCLPDCFCRCGEGGIATLAEGRGFDTFYVIERLSGNVVSVELR